MSRTEQQTILITGTSSGFGRLTAETLAREGYTVFAGMRQVGGRNAATAAQLRQWARDKGHALHVVELDVTDERSVQGAVAEVLRTSGRLDVLVNNAGTGAMGLAETFSVEQAQAILNTNVFGAYRLNRAVLPHLRERRSGLIIYVSSVLGRLLMPFMGIYAASKFALEALAENWDQELRPLGIDSTIIQPGGFATQFGANMLAPEDAARAASYGPVAEAVGAMMQKMGEVMLADGGPSPQLVADAILEVVRMPAGQRPLRRVVDPMTGGLVDNLNQAHAQAQQVLMKALSGS